MRALSQDDVVLLRQSLPESPDREIRPGEEPRLDDMVRRGLVRRTETDYKIEWLTTNRGRLLLAASEGK